MKEIGIPISLEAPSRNDAHRMFDRISGRYDLLNRILSLGLDMNWRRQAISQLDPISDLKILDLACGTGDMVVQALRTSSGRQVIGMDKSEKMLDFAGARLRKFDPDHRTMLVRADGMELPIANASVDAVTIAFGIRNMPDASACLKDIYRVIRRHGKLVILEFSMPTNRMLRSLHLFYLRNIVPLIGRILSGDSYAYSYLNKTIETFPDGESLCRMMTQAGFDTASYKPLTFGIVSVYTGIKN